MHHLAPWLATVALLGTGCLSASFTIAPDELEQIALTPAQERGQRVRVHQDVPGEDKQRRGHTPHAHNTACGHHHIALNEAGERVEHHTDYKLPRGNSFIVDDEGNTKQRSIGGMPKGSVVVFLLAAAVVVPTSVLATEGVHYDGWVNLEPDHPIRLTYRDGRTQATTLSKLTPDTAHHVHHATVVANGTHDVEFIGRAPLSRTGWTWKLEGGAMALTPPDRQATSLQPGALMEVGYFPSQHIGVVGFLTVAGSASNDGDSMLGLRYGAGLQLMPLHLGDVHLGAFGHVGMNSDGATGEDGHMVYRAYLMVGGGALVEYDVNTHFALSARAGAYAIAPGSDQAATAMLTTLGIALY